jgi:Zn-dependent protease
MSAHTAQHAPDSGAAANGRPARRANGAAAHSLRIGRIFGIPLEVHWSFLLLIGLVVAAEWPAGTGAIAGGLVWVAALFACVVAHELAHCLVARRRGVTVLGILLLPIGGMSRMDRIPDRAADEAAIAAIGPATSLVLGGLLLSVGAFLGSSMWPPTLVAGSWWARLGWLNLLLAVFNLLPALPMDGGRVLRAALAQRLPRLAATRVAASVAKVLAVGLIVAGVFYDFLLVFIGIFVFLGASGEESNARAEQLAKQQPPGWGWSGGWYPPQGAGPAGSYPPPSGPWSTGTWWVPPYGAGPSPDEPRPPTGQDPAWGPPWGPAWGPPWGQEPAPRDRSAIDVAVERGGPDTAGGEPGREGVGEHD